MNAQDKKVRRKANRKAKALGVDLYLLGSQAHAERKFNKVNTLNGIIDNGSLNDKLAAGKAKRAMNEIWLKSGRTVTAFGKPSEGYHEAVKFMVDRQG